MAKREDNLDQFWCPKCEKHVETPEGCQVINPNQPSARFVHAMCPDCKELLPVPEPWRKYPGDLEYSR